MTDTQELPDRSVEPTQPAKTQADPVTRIDQLPDETRLPADLAALYLYMSPAQLAELRAPKRTDGRAGSGPARIQHVEAGAAAQKQAPLYTLAVLRDFAKKHPPTYAFDLALNAGSLGWTTVKLPFFAELEPRIKRGRRVLIGGVWDRADPLREQHFIALMAGRIRFAWLTCSEAATSLWADPASHRAFADKGLALLRNEVQGIEAALQATDELAAGATAAAT
ncbi:hypothetical protein [Variovorax ginsengisoli]|uniref:Uncharacterized protein n=1 Tax=Variovorax ginsengisoli TaxID=363844 RepID=A0ABT9SDI2_9BURK|nr:hypothetical protein [Variovorax ginsengisoli]MDP9901432.1 hypothetical protein [Variovorax ginsengisoli]